MGYDKNMEYHIRLQYVVGQIGQKCMKPLCRKVAQTKGHSDYRSLLNENRVKLQIHHLRGINNGAQRMKNILTERQWFSLYKNSGDKNGCCSVTAREDVENMLDVSLMCKLMEHVFRDYIPVEIMNRLYNVLRVKEQIDGMCYMEESKFEELFQIARESLIEITKYTGTDLAQEMVNAEQGEIQSLVDEYTENYLKLRLLLKDPAERIMRSTMDVSMTKAGFKDREELFGNPFVQSELSRKALIWSSNRGCKRSQGSFLGQIFDISGHFKYVKESVVQCLCSFDFDFIYKLMRDLSVLSLELTPYTKEGVMSFIKNLRDIYGQVMRGCPDNKIGSSDFRRYWRTCEEALKTLLRFTGCSNDEEISGILKMNLRMSTSPRSNPGNPQIFRVRLEFPPDGLTKYEFSRTRVAEELRKHDKDGMKHYLPQFDEENYDLIFVHHEHHAAIETCECFFDAEATLTKIDPSEIQGSNIDNNRNPVVCLVDPNVHRISCRREYIGLLMKTALAELANTDFTQTTFPYLFDAKYCSEAEKRQIYLALQGVLSTKLSRVIEGIRTNHESSYLIGILEKHLQSIKEGNKGPFYMTKKFKEWLRSEMPSSIQCFSVSSKVKIYFKNGNEKRLREKILQNKFAEESDLEFVRMDDSLKFIPLFKPGTHLYRSLTDSEKCGSIALYGKLRSNFKRVAVSHGHVIQEGQRAYITREGVREELGNTIHPPRDDTETYPGELSVVEVGNEEVKRFLEEARDQHKEVVIYSGEAAALDKKKVVKFGSGTERTVGFVIEASLHADEFDDVCEGIVIQEQHQGIFAGPGDSGALAYIPKRRHIEGISLIYSQFELPDHENVVLTTKFHDCKSAFERNKNDEIEFESDHGLSVMGNTDNEISSQVAHMVTD